MKLTIGIPNGWDDTIKFFGFNVSGQHFASPKKFYLKLALASLIFPSRITSTFLLALSPPGMHIV